MKKDIILLGTALGSAAVLAILCAILKRRSKATYIDHVSDNDNGSDSDSPVLDTDHFPDKENEQLENKNQDPEENCVFDSEKEEEMFDFSDTIPEEELESLYGIENFDVPLDECDENVAANKSTAVDQNDSIKANIWLEDEMPSFRSETDEFAFWREAIENAQKHWRSEIYSVSFPKVMRYITRKGSASASGLKEKFNISYYTAKKIMQILTDHKLVSQLRGTYPRYVWISEEMWRAWRYNCVPDSDLPEAQEKSC